MKKLILIIFFLYGLTLQANTLVDQDTKSTLSAHCISWSNDGCEFFHITATVNDRTRTRDVDTEDDTYGFGRVRSYQWAYTDKETGDDFYTATYTAYSIPAFIVGDVHHPLAITLGIIFAPVGIVIDLVKLPKNTVVQISHKMSVESVQFLFKEENKSKKIPSKRFERILKRFHLGF